MEFVIVFPIYLVLFGGLFATGDLLLNSLRTPSSERTAAFDLARSDAGWTAVRALLFPSPYDGGLPQSPSSSAYYSDTQVRGPWTLRAAVKTEYAYRSPPWTRGWLAFSDGFFHDAVGTGATEGAVGGIIRGSRVLVYSKSESKPMRFNYYTLKRRLWKPPLRTWRWRGRPASDLVGPIWYESPWYEEVYHEQWHKTVEDGENSPRNPPPVGSMERYVRNPELVEWGRY